MRPGKKILVISPTPTHPTNAGNRARIDVLVSQIRDLGHDVHFLHVRREQGSDEQMRAAWGDKYLSVPYSLPRRRGAQRLRRLKSLIRADARYALPIDAWYDASLDAVVSALQAQHNFDVVMVEYVFFSRVLACFPDNVLKIIDTHDAFTNRHRLYLEKGQKPQWFSTTAREEGKGFDRADVVIAIQERERELFAKLTDREVITVGHLVVLRKTASPAGSKRILFVASANAINVAGLNHFMKTVLPRVRQRVRAAEVVVAGTVGEAVDDYPGLIKLGRVDDLAEVYAGAAVVVNPSLLGTGLSIKNLEALGYAKPLITSRISAHGLEQGAGAAFMVADDAGEFAESVVKVLTDPALARRFGDSAYTFAEHWNRGAIEQLESALSFG